MTGSPSGSHRLPSVQEKLTELQELLEQTQLDCAESLVEAEARALEKITWRSDMDTQYDELREQLARIQSDGDEGPGAHGREDGEISESLLQIIKEHHRNRRNLIASFFQECTAKKREHREEFLGRLRR